MTGAEVAGLGVALGAAVCFDGGYALQALEARRSEPARALQVSLLAGLARRPIWVAGIVLAIVGWGLQVVALRLAPVTLVQPALACGLILLLVLGRTLLHEPVGRREVGAALVVGAGVAVVALAAPQRGHGGLGTGLVVVLVALAALAAAPWGLARVGRAPGGLLVLAAGAGDVWAVLAARLAGDELARGRPLAAAGWTLGTALAVAGGLLAETSALQVLPATRVGPSVLVLQVIGPVALAPLVLGERWGDTPGGGAVLVVAIVALAGAAWALAGAPAAQRVTDDGPPPAGPALARPRGSSPSTTEAAESHSAHPG